jgi:hypothetical protein
MYSPLNENATSDEPISPYVYLMVGTCSKEGEHILLSPQLMSDKEIDEIVEQMKHELDIFSTNSKCELRALKKRQKTHKY